MHDLLDMDPPPSKSARRCADVGSIPRARPVREVLGRKSSEAKLRRLRRIAIVFACREQDPPVPYSTLIAVLGISGDSITRYHKLGLRRKLRKSRV